MHDYNHSDNLRNPYLEYCLERSVQLSVFYQEENRSLRYQLEIAQTRQEIDRRIQEKEDEFENVRKSLQRMIESLQVSLEGESKGRAEALRMKKKLESDIQELEQGLDHASKVYPYLMGIMLSISFQNNIQKFKITHLDIATTSI